MVRYLSMMQVHSGKERELDELIVLLEGADERLRLRNVVPPFGSLMSVSKVVREDAGRSDDHSLANPMATCIKKPAPGCHKSQLYRWQLPPDGCLSTPSQISA